MKNQVVDLSGTEKVKLMAEEAKELDGAQTFMEPGAAIKKKRGPKGPWKNKSSMGTPAHDGAGQSGTPAPSTPIRDPIQELKPLVVPIWGMIDEIAFKASGDDPEARAGHDRMEILVNCTAQVIHQYLPDAMSKHAPLIVLSLTVAQWGIVVNSIRQRNLSKLRAQKAQMNGQAPREKTAAPEMRQ